MGRCSSASVLMMSYLRDRRMMRGNGRIMVTHYPSLMPNYNVFRLMPDYSVSRLMSD